jgi:hypothetical protein
MMLQQYSNCNWSATGELECEGGGHGRGASGSSRHADASPTSGYNGMSNEHSVWDSSSMSGGSLLSQGDNYSGLSRELEVSVYTPPAHTSQREPPARMMPQLQPQHAQPQPQPQSQLQQRMPAQNIQSSQLAQTSAYGEPNWSKSPKYYDKFKKNVDKYYFQTPLQKYYELISELGQPTVVHTQKGGFAIWHEPGTLNAEYKMFTRIELIDEQCFNMFPYPHIGFLYTHYKIHIPTSILNRVLSISGDVKYDPITHCLIVRGMSMGYNMALTVLICKYVMGDISWYNIVEHDMIHKITHHKRLVNPKKQLYNKKFLAQFIKTKN